MQRVAVLTTMMVISLLPLAVRAQTHAVEREKHQERVAILQSRGEAEHRQLETSALRFMEVFDAGRTDDLWSSSEPLFQGMTSRETLAEFRETFRVGYGAMQSRFLMMSTFLDEEKLSFPSGQLAVVAYCAKYEKEYFIELVLMRADTDTDGEWRFAGLNFNPNDDKNPERLREVGSEVARCPPADPERRKAE